MRSDATFICVEVDDAVTGDAALAKKLEDACPVDIFAATANGVEIVEPNLDGCILCGLCLAAAPQGALPVPKLYSNEGLAPGTGQRCGAGAGSPRCCAPATAWPGGD